MNAVENILGHSLWILLVIALLSILYYAFVLMRIYRGRFPKILFWSAFVALAAVFFGYLISIGGYFLLLSGTSFGSEVALWLHPFVYLIQNAVGGIAFLIAAIAWLRWVLLQRKLAV